MPWVRRYGAGIRSVVRPSSTKSPATCAEVTRERAARRAGTAARNLKDAGLPKIIAGKLKRNAQESAGRADEVHEKRVDDARARLDAAYVVGRPEIVAEQVSADGTRKWLLRFPSRGAGKLEWQPLTRGLLYRLPQDGQFTLPLAGRPVHRAQGAGVDAGLLQ